MENDVPRGGPLSRRQFLVRTIALGAAVTAAPSLLVACSQPAATQAPAAAATGASKTGVATPAATAAIKRGGTMVHAINWTVPTMDPHLASVREHVIYENLYEGLTRFQKPDGSSAEHKVIGVLAESWEQKDARTLVFKLKQGVKFHDGSDFDASVAKWNFERARDHTKSQVKANLQVLESANVIDKYTLELKTKADNAALLRVISYPPAGMVRMVSKAAFDKNGEDWLQRNAVGTGPFRMKEWITDDRVISEAFPEYHDKGDDGKPLPYLDGLVIRYVPDPTVSINDMRAGQTHLVEWTQPKDIEMIKSDPALTFEEYAWAGQVYFMCGYNASKPPFNELKIRQAANYGIDRVGMHKALGFGVGAPHSYPYWAEGSLGYDETIEKYEYNPDKVKQLLTEAGVPNGVEIELKVIAREPENTIGEFVQQMWSAVGIKTKLVAQERLSWIDAVRANNFQACFWRGGLWSVIDPEMARTLVGCKQPINWQAICDEEVDRLLDEGVSELDKEKRIAIYNRMWRRIQEQAYAGTGFIAPMINSYRKQLHGVDVNFAVPNLRKAWLDS